MQRHPLCDIALNIFKERNGRGVCREKENWQILTGVPWHVGPWSSKTLKECTIYPCGDLHCTLTFSASFLLCVEFGGNNSIWVHLSENLLQDCCIFWKVQTYFRIYCCLISKHIYARSDVIHWREKPSCSRGAVVRVTKDCLVVFTSVNTAITAWEQIFLSKIYANYVRKVHNLLLKTSSKRHFQFEGFWS